MKVASTGIWSFVAIGLQQVIVNQSEIVQIVSTATGLPSEVTLHAVGLVVAVAALFVGPRQQEVKGK